jgi:hypothetical protein
MRENRLSGLMRGGQRGGKPSHLPAYSTPFDPLSIGSLEYAH